jgi:RNA polymerase sigma-70 factor, ECF subfamily
MLAEAQMGPEVSILPDGTGTAISSERLLEEHHATVFSYAYRLTGNSSAAEDVAQEVFVRAFRSLHQLRDDQAMRGWLLVITRNEFARWCKKFAPKSSVEIEEASESQAEEGSEAIDRAEWVQRALAQLPAEYQLVVNMFYFEQLSYVEIAESLSIPIGTVMSRLSRGRNHLKKSLIALAEPNTDPR